MPRLFIAIFNIPNKDVFTDIQKEIKENAVVKVVEPKNIHITLSFLGNVDEEEVHKIKNSLNEISKKFEPFEVKISGIKFIPSKNFVRVVAMDVKSDKINELSNDIKKTIGGDVKPPHLTLARIKNVRDKQKFLEIEKNELELKFIVKSIELVESKLTPKGPIYTVLESFSFSK